jgi:hypothetical protein
MTRVTFEGFTMDARTRDMVIALRVVCEASVVITQGCYNNGAVAASAGTHDGGGAVDIRMIGLTGTQQKEVEAKSRKIGFASWIRQPIPNVWPLHCHMIAIGCPDLSRGAEHQVGDYKAGRNGLANNGPDTGTRAWVAWTWEKYAKTYPELLTEDIVQQADIDKIVAAVTVAVVTKITPVIQSYSAFNAKNLTQQLAGALDSIETLDEKYANAVNAFIQQLDTADDADVAALKASLDKVVANTAPKA